jgi:thymidine phosphorylase
MKLTFLGAASRYRVKYLVETGNKRYLVDCGLFQGLKPLRLRNCEPLPFEPRSLSAVLSTYAHLDPIERALHVDSEGQLVASVLSKKIAAGSPHLVLDMPSGEGGRLAVLMVGDGQIWKKFQRICETQGGMRVPSVATQQHPLTAATPGTIISIDNRRIARLAKLAGASEAKAAGVELHFQLGDRIEAGQSICVVHADTSGELHYALDHAAANPDIVGISPE